MLVAYTGVKSGRAYLQPVSTARDGETLNPGGHWTLNLKGGRPVTLRLRGRPRAARADLVSDPAEVERLAGVNRGGQPARDAVASRSPPRDGTLEPEPLAAAIGHGFRIVRWHLDAA